MSKKDLILLLKEKEYSDKIIGAFAKVPREHFIAKELQERAYDDIALPLEEGATISQPSTIAFMLNLLELKHGQRILEIGSGSGYVLALLSEITKGEIYGIEISKNLAKISGKNLSEYKNIQVINKNGARGFPEKAPFDRVVLSAAADAPPLHLLKQLTSSGILVASVKNSIIKIKKFKHRYTTQTFPGFVFVPLVS